MTPAQYKKSIEKQELQLSASNKLSHYGIVLFLSGMFLLISFLSVKDNFQRPAFKAEIAIGLLLVFFAVISFWFQKKRLKFNVVETNLPKDKIINLVGEVGGQLGWTPIFIEENIIIAKTYPSFFSGSWGERVTVLFNGQKILVNSICDPDKTSSVTSMGRNKKNVQTLINRIKETS